MARPLARDAEDFAHLMLRTVERLGQDGSWVGAGQAFEQTLADHPDHAFVARLKTKPTRRIGFSAVVERVRAAEFSHLERRKGRRRNAPVHYRLARPDLALDLPLPYEVAPSHPLLVQRRAEAAPPDAGSARRAALTEASPKSPWRRRLLRRPAEAAGDTDAPSPLSALWARVSGLVAAIAGMAGR